MTYDPTLRRDTPLALKLRERVRQSGPLTVADYMNACLHDPEHGYYRTQQAIGSGADFVTAPEISQVFGELIGLWCVVVWQQMGSPPAFNLIELGPGRGTLMADALRAARIAPQFLAAATVCFHEPSPRLRAIQATTLAPLGIVPRYLGRNGQGSAAPGPAISIGNELLDCLPVEQLVWAGSEQGFGWYERTVELDGAGTLQFSHNPSPSQNAQVQRLAELGLDPKPGDIFESPDHANTLAWSLDHVAHEGHPIAGLFLDYGHFKSGLGDTLQAVRRHRYEHPLTSPGEADLTAHVDFAAFAAEKRRWAGSANSAASFTLDGPVTQAEFLGRLGIVERASKLMSANPAKAGEIETGVARLMAVPGMGDRFKVIGIRSPSLPPLPGF